MKISYFFRKKSPVFHSIEVQFHQMQKSLPANAQFINHHLKYKSKGLFRRIFAAIEVVFKQSDINHITGDIHFVAALLRKKKTILTIHDIGSALNGSPLKRIVIKLFWFNLPIRGVKYITVISEFTKKELLANFKINPQKIFIIPNSISSELKFSPYEFNSSCPVIFQIGTKLNKNLPKLFKAVKDIKCKLIIVGKLSEEQKNLLENYKIDFENYTNLPYSEIVKLYIKSDMVSFVSLYEGFGVPVLEANAMGRPVITSNISPMKEVADGCAYLVNPDSSDEIRTAVIDIIKDKKLRESLVSMGLKNAEKYSAEAVARKYYDLYQKITNRHSELDSES